MSLVFSRKVGESFRSGETIVKVLDARPGRVMLAIDAPPHIPIVRSELEERYDRCEEDENESA